MIQKIKDIYHGDVGPTVYDRKSKETFTERMPLYKYIENEIFYCKVIDKIDQNAFVRKCFKNESIHDGHVYNKPESAKDIPGFIEFYEIDMSQFKKEKAEEYTTFNDFFTREVKPEARPICEPKDNSIISSAADCRLIVFESLDECKDLWIKGKQFSFEGLLDGDKELTECFVGGKVANFRLAPQDYHRFHVPIGGRIIKKKYIDGNTLSVKPVAIQSEVDVLGKNERFVLVIQTEEFGKICYVPIGAEAVGRVTVFAEEGQEVKKGEEIGYFSYGGSDIVALFENQVEWDEEIRMHSKNAMETRVYCGERIGEFKTKK